VLLISVPYRALPDVGKNLGSLVKGKVVIDTCNPIPSRYGDISTWAREKGAGLASAELLPGARLRMPIAGDDPQAIELASHLIREIGTSPF
jgi:predicted dinucleotide-binding enzyme